jgi:hypothetical protein
LNIDLVLDEIPKHTVATRKIPEKQEIRRNNRKRQKKH